MCTMSLHVEGHFVAATKMCEGYTWKVDWETLKCIQVAHGRSQKFKYEIHQNLVHILVWCCGSGLEE